MTGHWEGSARTDELPHDWAQIRAAVLERDRYRCSCGAQATDVDHIRPGNDHSLTNLQALCRRCHTAKSSREGNQARWQHRRARPPERHPGLTG